MKISIGIHALIVTLILVFGVATHRLNKQMYVTHLTFVPADLPAPIRAIRRTRASESASDNRAAHQRFTAPVLLTISAVRSPEKPEVAPGFLKLDTSSSLALPQATRGAVSEGPQARPAGFGSGLASGTSDGHATVLRAVLKRPAVSTAPTVTYEPKPRYTPEALRAHAQGEVTLRVTFRADGTVRVLGVVNSLGYGLDEQATLVAEGIRFTPGSLNGVPVDHITLIHVVFELA